MAPRSTVVTYNGTNATFSHNSLVYTLQQAEFSLQFSNIFGTKFAVNGTFLLPYEKRALDYVVYCRNRKRYYSEEQNIDVSNLKSIDLELAYIDAQNLSKHFVDTFKIFVEDQ